VEKDSFGRNRTIYSLRHTYATFRLHEGVNHYVLSRNMGTSVKMLEDYYGHTSNITMSDELTKTKSTTQKSRQTNKKDKGTDPIFGWLKTVENRVSETQKKVRKIPDNKEVSTGPTHVDLINE
jgi:hypothetical protein